MFTKIKIVFFFVLFVISNSASFAQYSLASISGTTTFRATANGPSPANNTCNCPTGSVVVGIKGYEGSYVDKVTLKCAVLNSNGTLGSTVDLTTYNGNSTGGNTFNETLAGGSAMVGAEIRTGNDLDGLKMRGNTIVNIGNSSANSSGSAGTQQGGTGGTLYTDYAPNSMVIVGMNFKSGSTYAGGMSFNYAKINYTCTNSTAPSSISGTTAVCAGNSTTLTAQGGSLGTGASYQWYAGGCGSGSSLGSGSSITVSPTSTTTYYARRTGTCNTTSCASTTVTHNSASTAPTSISGTTTICSGSSTTLSASGGSSGGGASFQWYAGGCGSGSSLGSGSSITVSPTSTTTYYARRTGTCNTTSCVSTTVTVNSASTAPSSISGTTTVCAGNSTTLSASGGSLGSGSSYQWYAGGCGSGSSLGSGSSISVSPTTSTTYYLRISGTCNTTSCVNTTVAVNSLSTVPSGITGTTAICNGNSTTLSASGGSLGAGASYQWFAGGCASGSSLGSGSSLSVSPTSNTSYFLRISGTCNTTSCVNQTVSVTTAPVAGTLSGNQTICPNGSTTFTTNGNIGGLWSSSNSAVATVNSSGSINGVTAGTATITYTVSGSGGCNNATATRNVTVSDITLTSNTSSGDFVWNGSTSNSWTNLSNWSVYNGVSIVNASIFPTQLDNVVLPLNNTCVVFQPSISATNDTIKGLKIESGATFTMSNSTLVVTGNWVQNGSFIPGNGNVIFKGSAAQSISGVGTISFANLIVNNSSSGLNLLTPVEISTSLTMLSGNISTSTLNSLTLGIGAAGILNWTSGTITGPFKRWFTNASNTGNSTGLFPVGTASENRWALLEYTSAPVTAGYISAEFKAIDPSTTSAGINGLPLVDQYNWSINNIATDGYWEIIPISAVGGTYNLKLRPKAFSLSNLYDVGRIIKSPNDHSTWVLNGNHGSINGSQTDFTISRIGMSGFSYFAIGYTNNAPLPVTLISFQANCIQDYTSIISWTTASESNSSYFQLEKSRDGINWQLLSVIEATGNSTTKIDYEFFDLEKFSGVFYYRLKQIDFNGCEITYGPISVSCSDVENSMIVFPNPSNGDFTISSSEVGTFNIINELGQLVRTVEITEANNNQVKVEDMPNGAYFVTGTLNGNIVTKKVIVVR
jgi:hypothetical protein